MLKRKDNKMDKKEEILQYINEIRLNESELYSYLYDLIYKEIISDVKWLEHVYAGFLEDQRNEIKRIAIYGILFGLKIQKDVYLDFALKNKKDIESDFDLRLTCVSGLSAAYFGTKNVKIVSLLFLVFNNIDEDEDIQCTCFTSLLMLIGLSSRDIFLKNKGLIFNLNDINLGNFKRELQLLTNIIYNPN